MKPFSWNMVSICYLLYDMRFFLFSFVHKWKRFHIINEEAISDKLLIYVADPRS